MVPVVDQEKMKMGNHVQIAQKVKLGAQIATERVKLNVVTAMVVDQMSVVNVMVEAETVVIIVVGVECTTVQNATNLSIG